MGTTPAGLRRYLQEGDDPTLQRRRATVAVSLVGLAAMACTTLLQMGLVQRLPDPPVGNFDTRRVNSADEAYSYGGPDSPVAIAGHALAIVLAAMGGEDRARRHPWLPLLAALVSLGQVPTAAKYLFYTMPKVDRTWCPYCITDALTQFATLALVTPEALQAARELARRLDR